MIVRVVAAIMRRNGRILITRRLANVHLAGMWEFPGGKVEAEESLDAALQREILEELGLRVRVLQQVFEVVHADEDRSLQLHFFACEILSGEPQALHVADLRWVLPGEMDADDFPPADRALIALLRQEPAD